MIINEYTDVFITDPSPGCVFDSCELKQMDPGSFCEINLPEQTDIVFGASFEITATELKPEGYSYDLCYSCGIKETAT